MARYIEVEKLKKFIEENCFTTNSPLLAQKATIKNDLFDFIDNNDIETGEDIWQDIY